MLALVDTNLSSYINVNSFQFYSSDNDLGELSLLGTPSTLIDPLWYPDSGATHHITHDNNIFSFKTPYTSSEVVQLGNCISMNIRHIGSAKFIILTL